MDFKLVILVITLAYTSSSQGAEEVKKVEEVKKGEEVVAVATDVPYKGRACDTDKDCLFESVQGRDRAETLQLTCSDNNAGFFNKINIFREQEKNFCLCKNKPPVDFYIPELTVEEINGKCRIWSYMAPCGTNNGMSIDCKQPFECIQSKCRLPERLGTKIAGERCYDDVDCVTGLKCKITGEKLVRGEDVPTYGCASPDTPDVTIIHHVVNDD